MGITRQQALDCFASDDLIGIGMEADAVRRRLHPEGVVSYALDGHVSLQPVTGASLSREDSLRLEQVSTEIRAILEGGGTGVSVHAEVRSGVDMEGIARSLRAIKQGFPRLWLSGFSASEVLALSQRSQHSVGNTLGQLRGAGLDALAEDDAELLEEAGRQQTFSRRCSAEDWLSVHREAHRLGMRSTATMLFGAGETPEQRVNHLETLRRLQEDTGGFLAFSPRLSKAAAGRNADEATSVELLKTLAVCRMVLDNIEQIQTSSATQGLKVLQMGLRFGSNDVGSIHAEDANGTALKSKGTTEEELRRVIRDAGFKPAQRDAVFQTMFLP